jgi:threonine/homoserine/homoserine lactone efflux protein
MITGNLITFIVALTVSALGSVPVGAINLMTIQISVKHGLRTCLLFILLASLAELPHIALTLWLSQFIEHNTLIQTYFEYGAIAFILVMGLANVFKKSPSADSKASRFSWSTAFFITLFNPFSIPFWLFFTTYLLNEHWLMPGYSSTLYIIGAIIGALITLIGYSLLGNWITKTNLLQRVNIDKVIGFVFLGIAVWKIGGLVV